MPHHGDGHLQPLLPARPAPEKEEADHRGQLPAAANSRNTTSRWLVIVPWALCLLLAVAWGNERYIRSAWSNGSSVVADPEGGALPAEASHLQQCPSPIAPSVKAPRRNVWKNLSIKEANEIRTWLYDSARGLNLTAVRGAFDSDNTLHVLESYRPAKNLTLAYLAGGAVKAVMHNGTTNRIGNYLVGPLPLSDDTVISPMTEMYHNPDIPLNARSTFNWTQLHEHVSRIIDPLEPIFIDLFNGSFTNGTLLPAGVGPMSYDGEWRRSWIQLRRNVPGAWLVPIDFYVYVDMSGTDPSLFHAIRYAHDGVTYRSFDDLTTAWKRGELRRHTAYDTAWTTRRIPHSAKPLDLDDRSGPRRFAYDGARFRLDKEEGYVTWMGWAFYTAFERDMGLRFYDIRFRGDRIIYELSPQEAMAQYSGNNPHQASTVWLDRAFGMGGQVREVMIGYDCPYDATLMSATIHEAGSSVRPNAICIFEQERPTPISRHVGFDKDESGAVKGYELVVRSISTVGNYDYIFDYTYQLDGTLEIRVSASGYLQGGAWDATEDAYGHRLNRESMGSLHDHVINFKVDFDIVDEGNSMMAVSLETERKKVDWLDEDEPWGDELVQQRIVRKPVHTETRLGYPANMEGAYVVYSPAHRNAWGNHRGYSIHPGPLCHLTNLHSPRTAKQVGWAKTHLAVTRRKDDESESSSMWNMNLPGRPPFFDDEPIDDEDLVVWLNLGTHHIPRAEDTPNTLTNLATSYVLLAPWNFNDYDVSIDSRNSILLNRHLDASARMSAEYEAESVLGQRYGDEDDHRTGNIKTGKSDFVWEEVVPPKQCIPAPIIGQRYRGVVEWDEAGVPVERGRLQELMPHRVKS